MSHSAIKPFLGITALWLAVIVSALGVIYTNHLCRSLYAELAVLERQKNSLQVDWGRYLLEQSSWVSLGRVESRATSELNMRVPEAHEIVMVNP